MSRFFRSSFSLIFALSLLSGGGTPADAEILHEQGSLRGFLGGSCPGCAYDNWITHIAEGIARPGFNDYGPLGLDPQMNGFGHYAAIPDTGTGNTTILNWYRIFAAFFLSDTARADSILYAAQLDSIYDLVVLHDSTRIYYILREQLNPAYYDTQATAADSSDDMRGSFDHAWGVYIFSPTAARPNVMLQAPHPEDDFISPYVCTDVFQLLSAGALMIAGAGREVLWTEQGEYDNSKSLSDPSRIYQTVFHTAHRAFTGIHSNDLTLQLHSYDTQLHPDRKSLVISAGADDGFPNEPILDRCAFDDMISYTPLVAVPANTCGDHPDVTVADYYALYYEGGYRHQGSGPAIATNGDLMGYGQNRQILFSHIGHNRYRHAENILHIEMDEFPDAIRDSMWVFYRTELPGVVTLENFTRALDYYRPAYEALALALEREPMATQIAAIPGSVDFGSIPVQSTTSRTVTFQNISPSNTLHVIGAFTNNSVFALSNVPQNILLAPGQACSLSVSFTPDAPNLHFGVLTLDTDSGCSHLEVRGTGIAPLILLTPDSIGFDTVEAGVPDTLSVTCNNPGYMNLQLYGFLSCGVAARFLPPADSVIAPQTNEILKIEFAPQNIGAIVCSVAVISNAFNADTAWVTVTATGTATPDTVNGLTVYRAGNHMRLRWPRVTTTTRGVPLPADGYRVTARANLAYEDTLLAITPETLYMDSNAVVSNQRRFYQVTAFYEFPPANGDSLLPDVSHSRAQSLARHSQFK